LPSDDARTRGGLGEHPFRRVVEAIVGIGVTVRPSIHGDSNDIARRIEAPRGQNARELISDLELECFKTGCQQLRSADAMLLLAWEPSRAGRARKTHRNRF